MANPLVRQLGLKQILQREAEKPPEPRELDESTYSALASHVRTAWGRNKLAKQKIELKMLDCLRARRGVYSPAAQAQMQAQGGGMNIVFSDLSETKCKAASAWIREIVLPVGERPWGVSPTPLPDLPKALKDRIVDKALAQAQEAMQQAAQAGATMTRDEFKSLVVELGEKLRSEAEETVRKVAMERAERMEQQIADRLAEGGYEEAIDAFVESFVTYQAAILKGPYYTHKKKLEWGAGFTPKVSNLPTQTWANVAVFDAYPAPSAHSPQDGDFIERERFLRKDLYDLKGLPGYNDEQIDAALMDYSNGHLEGWLWTEAERQRLEQESMYMWLSPPGVIDAINYWGSVPGWKLKSWGVQGDLEETREYECNVLLCGRYVLYAALNTDPLGKRPYWKACYDEIPGAFWGRSIPDLAATSQKMCNAIACALADNLSISSGPQVWVHADRFADGEQTLELFPWKIWQLKSDPTQGVNPGIGFFQPDDRAVPLMATYEKWEIKADDTTGIPRYTYGNERAGGSADTATGLSMLMNNAAKGLRRAIGNIDLHVIQPTISQCFVNEMLYNPDESIKGDAQIVPRGANAILIKESAQQRRIQALGMTANPIDMQILGLKGRAALLRETFQAMDIPADVVPDEDQIEKQMAQQAQAAEAQQNQLMQVEQQKLQLQMQGEQQNKMLDIVTKVVEQAIAAAMSADKSEKSAAPAKENKAVALQ